MSAAGMGGKDAEMPALEKAEALIGWLRRMTMEGQITMSDYARSLKPSDYEAYEVVAAALAAAKGGAR